MPPVHGLVEEPVPVVASHTDNDGLDRLGEVEEFAATVAEAHHDTLVPDGQTRHARNLKKGRTP